MMNAQNILIRERPTIKHLYAMKDKNIEPRIGADIPQLVYPGCIIRGNL